MSGPVSRACGIVHFLWIVVAAVGLSSIATARADGPATRSTGPTTRTASSATAPATRAIGMVSAPKTVADLRALQTRVENVVRKTLPATVGVMLGGGQGSGVIISKDGYVLTAGHVASEPGKDVTLILSDGRKVKGKTLGVNRGIDSGLIKITTPGDWAYVEMGKSAPLRSGEWCVALGHPGGYRKDRPPVLRLGRVEVNSDRLILTDCTLVGGDSGGPLFDLDGKVIGIHSRIGSSATANIHVPIDTYTQTWDRLVKGDLWGMPITPNRVVLGVMAEDDPRGCKVTGLTPNSPAGKAGVQIGDIIARLDGQRMSNVESLVAALGKKKVGDEVRVELIRKDVTMVLNAKLAARDGN